LSRFGWAGIPGGSFAQASNGGQFQLCIHLFAGDPGCPSSLCCFQQLSSERGRRPQRHFPSASSILRRASIRSVGLVTVPFPQGTHQSALAVFVAGGFGSDFPATRGAITTNFSWREVRTSEFGRGRSRREPTACRRDGCDKQSSRDNADLIIEGRPRPLFPSLVVSEQGLALAPGL